MDLLNKLLVKSNSAVSSIKRRSSAKKRETPVAKSENSVCITEEERAESETSTIRDASMILDHSVASEEDFLTDVKRKKVKQCDVKISTLNLS